MDARSGWKSSAVDPSHAGARNTSALTPKFVGFHRCLPRNRSTYFEVIEIKLVKKYGLQRPAANEADSPLR